MKGLTVGVVGCGNMGSAIVRGMVRKDVLKSGAILLNDKDIEKADALAKETGCRQEELSSLVSSCDLIIIAVKPQDSEDLLKGISENITRQTIVSVMAGLSIDAITNMLGKEVPVARAMPNMAAFIGESITCISYNGMVSKTEEIKNIFGGIGKVLGIDEIFQDGVTALSGSGPAYLFYLAQAMIDAGKEMGIDKDVAKELVIQTLYGSAALMRKTEDLPQELVKKVASKGGTTEAALSVFDENNLNAVIKTAVRKAKKRSEELSQGAKGCS
jgi:pyrroline-5-carboxylate reductase